MKTERSIMGGEAITGESHVRGEPCQLMEWCRILLELYLTTAGRLTSLCLTLVWLHASLSHDS